MPCIGETGSEEISPSDIVLGCGHCVNEHVGVIVKEVVKVWVWKVLHPAVDAADDSFLKYVVWSRSRIEDVFE